MNPPHNNGHPVTLVAKLFIFFLFFITATSLLGSGDRKFMNPGEENNSNNTRNSTGGRNKAATSNEITAENRRLLDDLGSNNPGDNQIQSNEEQDISNLEPHEQNYNEIASPSSTPVKQPGSFDSRRLSGMLPLPLAKQAQADLEEIEAVNKSDFAKTVTTTVTIRKAAQKFKQALASRYKGFTALHTEHQRTQDQRSQIFTHSASIRSKAKATQELLEEEFVKKTKTALQKRAALNLVRGMPPLFSLPKATLVTIKRKSFEKNLIADLSTELALYQSDSNLLRSYLSKRRALLPDEEKSEDPFRRLNGEADKALQLVQETGKKLIQKIIPDFQPTDEEFSQTFENLSSLTSEQIGYLEQSLTLIRETQLFVLGCHTSTYITASKNKLDEIEAYLNTDILLKEKSISPSVRNEYTESKKLLSETKALFSLKETIPTAATIQAAKESAATIQNRLIEIEKCKTVLNAALERAEKPNIPILQKEANVMSQLQTCFQDAALLYQAIQDEAEIEKACGSLADLKKKIQEHSSSLPNKEPRLSEEDLTPLLNELISPFDNPVFALDEADLLPQHPLLFLDRLECSDESLNKQHIIDTHGKIGFLDSLPEKTDGIYPITMKRLWVSGIDTIREGLRQGWGLHIVQEFDKDFEPFIRMGIPLQISDLKNFLFDQDGNLKYARSFFIPLEMTHKKFLEHLKTHKTEHVIKFDAATLAVNPFDKNPLPPTQETTTAAELRQRQAGFEYNREALKLAFPETSLSTEQLERILERFDDQFKTTTSINEKPPLTQQAASTFIDTQKDILSRRGCWERYVTRYCDQESIRYIRYGLLYNIGTYILPVLIGLLSYLYLHYHSLTHTIS